MACDKAGILDACGPWTREVHHDGARNIFYVRENGHDRFYTKSAYEAHAYFTKEVAIWKQLQLEGSPV